MRLSKKHKAVVDEYFRNDFKQSDAYMKVYPNVSITIARSSAWRLMQRDEVKSYVDYRYKKYRKELDIDKQGLLDQLMKQVRLYDTMLELALRDVLTLEEEEKLDRINKMLKGSDINAARNMIAKIIGAYEPEKVETKIEWNIGFGDDES